MECVFNNRINRIDLTSFEIPPKPERLRAAQIVYDDRIASISLCGERVPADWSSRALYLGDDGARAWLEICRNDRYTMANRLAFGLGEKRREALANVDPKTETLVSLGPGDGEVDVELLETLSDSLTRIRYIPVEISTGLLAVTVQRVPPSIDIPVAVLGDFESGLRVVERALWNTGAAEAGPIQPPRGDVQQSGPSRIPVPRGPPPGHAAG